jgi:hypothetical protein
LILLIQAARCIDHHQLAAGRVRYSDVRVWRRGLSSSADVSLKPALAHLRVIAPAVSKMIGQAAASHQIFCVKTSPADRRRPMTPSYTNGIDGYPDLAAWIDDINGRYLRCRYGPADTNAGRRTAIAALRRQSRRFAPIAAAQQQRKKTA